MPLRQQSFDAVYDLGTALLKQQHPAQSIIEAKLITVQVNWKWLCALMQCLEHHLADASNLKKFLEEAKNMEHSMAQLVEPLKIDYGRPNVTLEVGEKKLKELHGMKEMLDEYKNRLISLSERSQTQSPLWQRGQRINQAITVTALCDYQDRQVSSIFIQRGGDQLGWALRPSDFDPLP